MDRDQHAPQVGKVVDGIQQVCCPTWEAFMAYIHEEHLLSHGVTWRGQSNSEWPLEPTLVRKIKKMWCRENHPPGCAECDRKPLPESILRSYGGRLFYVFEEAFSVVDDLPSERIGRWAIGQHHGLWSPYLDWTRSPYVAAFFAAVEVGENMTDREDRHLAVYGITQFFPQNPNLLTADRTPTTDVVLFGRDLLARWNPRAVAQQGLAACVFPPVDVESLVARLYGGKEEPVLRKMLLPYSEAWTALCHLNRMNINYRTLFPDVEGAVRHANLCSINADYMGRGGRGEGFEELRHVLDAMFGPGRDFGPAPVGE